MTSTSPQLRPVAGRSSLPEYLGELWERRDFIRTMPRHNLLAQNLDTRLGSLWLLVNPLLLTAIYWSIFGLLLGIDRGQPNFITFLIIGVLVYRWFASSTVSAARSITRNQGLIRSLYFPRATIPLSSALGSLYGFLPGLSIMMIVALATGERPDWQWLLTPAILLMTGIFITGSMLICARLGHVFPDLSELLPHITRLGLYASGVLYAPERFTENDAVLAVFHVNPIYQFLSLTRWCLTDQTIERWYWITAPAWALVMFLGGFVYFWRAEMSYGSQQ